MTEGTLGLGTRDRLADYWSRTLLGELVASAATRPNLAGFLFFGALATFVYRFTAPAEPTHLDYFVRLADAFLHGRYWLTEGPSWLNELVPIGARFYVVYPPLPALLLVPFVVLFGTEVPQQVASALFGGIGVGLAWVLFRQAGLRGRVLVMLTVVFAFGTVLWWAAETGTAWVTSHTVAVLFLTAALILGLRRERPFVAGLLLGAAMLARLPVVLALPFLVGMYAELERPADLRRLVEPIRLERVMRLGIGVGLFVLAYLAYNVARWGTVLDRGYTLIPGVLVDPIYEAHGIFAIDYVPRHVFAILLRSWNFVDQPPFLQPSWWGLGLFLTTPLLLWLVRARLSDPRVAWALLATAVILVPIALHGNVGVAQFGYRFSLDFQPLLFLVLATVFAARGVSRLAWAAGAASVVGCAYAVWAIGIDFVAY